MFQIRTYNKIAESGLKRLSQENYKVSDSIDSPDAILLRSHKLANSDVPESVLAIARAGAGVNNIPVSEMNSRGIPVFNTPGANANAVKELVMAGLLLSARHLCQAFEYTKQLEGDNEAFHQAVESGKKQFIGSELPGRTLGVIGLGAIGVKVANAAQSLGMRVIGYDPAITVKSAWQLSAQVEQAGNLDQLLGQCDFITLHIPLLDATRELMNAKRLKQLPKGAVLLNFARGEVVDEKAVLDALNEKHLKAYVCDFPTPTLYQQPGVISLPHLGASTVEAEENCAVMAVDQIRDYLEHGQIKNSVNFPEIMLPRQGKVRVCIANANVPKMVAQISTIIGQSDLNIIEMLNRSHDDVAYTVIDVDKDVPKSIIDSIHDIEGILSTRVIA